MDPRQSNVGEGSSEGFVPGGNNTAFQTPWNPYMYPMFTMMTPNSQGFQPIAPNVQMMTPNCFAPQGGQAAEAPEASTQHLEADVEQVAAPAASTGKRKSKSLGTRTKLGNFTADEDTNLVKAWLEISCDPITSTGQKRERMWERILERYNLRRGSNPARSVRSLQSRWDLIKTEVGLFAAYYADSIRENPSGMTDACKTTHAVGNFASVRNRKFCFLHCWELMKDEPKWQDPQLRESAAAAQGEGFVDDTTRGTETLANEQGQPTPDRSAAQPTRPIGRDSAKAARKKANSDAASTSSAEYAAKMQELSLQKYTMAREESQRKDERFQQLTSIDEKRYEDMRKHNDALLQLEQQKFQFMIEKQEKEEDERILAINLDTCTPAQRVYYQALQDDILAKITARRQRS